MASPVTSSGAVAADFPGLLGNTGTDAPQDQPGAARDQVNLTCQRPGEIRARPGHRPVAYDREGYVPAPGTVSSILPAL